MNLLLTEHATQVQIQEMLAEYGSMIKIVESVTLEILGGVI